MPLLRVSIDGTQIAAVSTAGLDVVNVSLHGAKIYQEFATLNFSGGCYPTKKQSTHLSWLSEVVLRPGQCVRVQVAGFGASSYPGRTIDELYHRKGDESELCVVSQVGMRELEGWPQVRASYEIGVQTSKGQTYTAATRSEECGFEASFLWSSVRPEGVSASLRTYTLAQLKKNKLTKHYRESLMPGAWVDLTVDT